MGKYSPLGNYLKKYPEKKCILSTGKIEEIIKSRLPYSARNYRQWWENGSTHVQARDGWLDSGWKVDSVSMDYSMITFVKK